MDFQTRVRDFLARYGLRHTAHVHALDLSSEVGEVAKAILEASNYGRSPVTLEDALVEELGDTFFSLIALAESLDVDLEMALSAALNKYEARLANKGHSGSGDLPSPLDQVAAATST